MRMIRLLAVVLLLFVGTVAFGAPAGLTVLAQNAGSEPSTSPAQAALPSSDAPASDRNWTDPATGMEFVWVPDGCYQMGSNAGEDDEKPVHEVCVDGFWMGKCEVTQAQWRQVMGTVPSRFKGDRNPVDKVSWDKAQEFIKWLNANGNGTFRLPTEAEWEYAARFGGEDEKYPGSNDVDSVAWYDSTSAVTTHPVGTKAPNSLGIYDLGGNIGEWCQDVYNLSAYSQHPGKNPVYSGKGTYRVTRGGSWNDGPMFIRSTARTMAEPDFSSDTLGFRLLRTK